MRHATPGFSPRPIGCRSPAIGTFGVVERKTPDRGDVTASYGRYFTHAQQAAHLDGSEADSNEIEFTGNSCGHVCEHKMGTLDWASAGWAHLLCVPADIAQWIGHIVGEIIPIFSHRRTPLTSPHRVKDFFPCVAMRRRCWVKVWDLLS